MTATVEARTQGSSETPTQAPPRAGRDVYRDRLLERLATDPRTVILDSDTGLFDLEKIPPEHRDRYLNIGIAEQNLMGVAAGLARDGYRPWVNTMATFASTRALESVKLDIAYPNLPVRIAATHSGLSAGHLGPTHHGLEDVGILRMIPNMTIVVPAGPAQTEAVVDASDAIAGPLYLRLGRKPIDDLVPAEFTLGQPQVLREGKEIVLVGCGAGAVAAALEAADLLLADGVRTRVVNLHTVKPLDAERVRDVMRGTRLCVTVEEHWREGGIGSALAELAADGVGQRPEVLRVGVPDRFVSYAGDERHLLHTNGIDGPSLVQLIRGRG